MTVGGQTFRPSDWAERLAGVMSSFRPGGVAPGDHLSYSPWCVPTTNDAGQKCVIVHVDLRDAEVPGQPVAGGQRGFGAVTTKKPSCDGFLLC
jgi:hypothetical protein